ncbi:MAG: phosphoglycolate phosphatase [Methanomicrobiaceae archaeon]|nr:phosphoglycolate phosphatase [Methanomicrobiaceae archaeon]
MAEPHAPTALVCDVDGTITDARRRISTDAILVLRRLIDSGVPVVLASGNTICSMNILCKMIGTDGSVIAENGGVYRHTYSGAEHVEGDRSVAWKAFRLVEEHFSGQGEELELYSPDERRADVAFARSVDPDEVRRILSGLPVKVLDTGFAIHLQERGANKGRALLKLAGEMSLSTGMFLAVGDSMNDFEMLASAGTRATVANGDERLKEIADFVAGKTYGDGFVEAVVRFFPHFFDT